MAMAKAAFLPSIVSSANTHANVVSAYSWPVTHTSKQRFKVDRSHATQVTLVRA